ncbi:TetR-like C-terminal domain-containing protein [Nocardia sp. NPDC050193]
MHTAGRRTRRHLPGATAATQRAAVATRLTTAIAAGELRSDLDIEVAIDLLLGPVQTRWSLGLCGLTPAYADTVLAVALTFLRP